TAGFGLGLNRAALFIRDSEHNKLIGAMGIGYFDINENKEVWETMVENKVDSLKAIRQQLDTDLPQTPLGERITGLEIPIESREDDILSAVVTDGHWRRL